MAGLGIALRGLGLLGKTKKSLIKKRKMSTEDKIKTGVVIGTGAAVTGLGVLKVKSEIDQVYGKTKKNKK